MRDRIRGWFQRLERRHFLTFAILFLLGTLIYFLRVRYIDTPDLKVFYTAGKHAWNNPRLLYLDSPDRFLYLPIASFFFIPLAWISSWSLAQFVFFLISWFALLILSWGSWARLVALLLLTRYVMINLEYGQVNLLVLLGFFAIHHALPRHPTAAGIGLAISGSLKIFPLVQGLEFFSLRKWKAIAVSIVCFLILLVFPFLFWPSEVVVQSYQGFFHQMGEKGLPTYSHNQSWAAILSRYLRAQDFDLFSIGAVNWSIADFSSQTIRSWAFFLGLVLSAWAWFRAQQRRATLDFISATGFTIIFLSHIVWKPYLVFLFPALAQVLESPRSFRNPWLWGFLFCGPLISPEVIGFRNSAIWDASGMQMIGALLLFKAWSSRSISVLNEQSK